MKPIGFVMHWPCDPEPRSRSVNSCLKWLKPVVPMSTAGKKKKLVEKFACNVKQSFCHARWLPGQPGGRTWLTKQINITILIRINNHRGCTDLLNYSGLTHIFSRRSKSWPHSIAAFFPQGLVNHLQTCLWVIQHRMEVLHVTVTVIPILHLSQHNVYRSSWVATVLLMYTEHVHSLIHVYSLWQIIQSCVFSTLL